MAKRLSIIAAVALTGMLVASLPGWALTLRTVSDNAKRFTIGVPVTWEVKTEVGYSALVATAPAPPKLTPDSVNVIVRNTPMTLSAQECVQEAQGVLKYVVHSYTEVSQGPLTIGKLPAYSYVYSWHTNAGEPRRSQAVCTTIGREAFMIIGTTEDTPANVRAVMPQISQIITTFRPSAQLLASLSASPTKREK